jgi:transketolase
MNLQEKSDRLRNEVIHIAVQNNAGHLASSLSCHNILVALYYNIMTKDDHLILSKAHGCYSLYAILADKGIMPKDQWENFNTDKSQLKGCAVYKPEWGIEAGCGSLGHGLPMAVGMAYAMKLQKKPGTVYCIIGDGELEEGTTWESLNFIREHGLNNIVIIIDNNKLRALDGIIKLEMPVCLTASIKDNIEDIITALKLDTYRFRLLIISTTKGKGLICMENQPKFHYRVPTAEELEEGKTYGN